MDWAKKEVSSVELSKKLKELGFPQTPDGYYWVKFSENYDLYFYYDLCFDPEEKEKVWGVHTVSGLVEPAETIKAPTNSELGEWLPFYLPELGFLRIEKNEDGFHYYYDAIALKGCYFIEKIEANARAKTLIWLRKNGCITFNQGDKNNAQPRQQT